MNIRKITSDYSVTHMRIPEVANVLRCSVYTVRRWCNEGKFPGAVKLGGYWLIPKEDVNEFLSKRETA